MISRRNFASATKQRLQRIPVVVVVRKGGSNTSLEGIERRVAAIRAHMPLRKRRDVLSKAMSEVYIKIALLSLRKRIYERKK